MHESILGHHDMPLSHFYLIEGDREAVIPHIRRALSARGILLDTNPDVVIEEYMSFTVDDAALLRKRQSEQATGGQGKFFIIAAQAIIREAEQSLLKALEEPTPGTHFIFIVRSLGHVADTIKSRAQIRRIAEVVEHQSSLLPVAEFLRSTPPERLAMITKYLKSHEDDETTGALRDGAFAFMSELEPALGHMLENNPKEVTTALHYIYDAKRYLGLRGMSMKMMLEYLVFIVPTVGK